MRQLINANVLNLEDKEIEKEKLQSKVLQNLGDFSPAQDILAISDVKEDGVNYYDGTQSTPNALSYSRLRDNLQEVLSASKEVKRSSLKEILTNCSVYRELNEGFFVNKSALGFC